MTTSTSHGENQLSYLNDEERLDVYKNIVSGCKHIYSKGKLQEDKLESVMENLIILSKKDPYFLAHLTSYVFNKLNDKDLKVLTVFANSLSDADGTPFSPGSKYKKPNLRLVSQAGVQELDPKLVSRVIEVANKKKAWGHLSEGTHFTRGLTNAIKRYLKFREMNPQSLEGIRKVGLSKKYRNIYRDTHTAPSDEAASLLGWQQKNKKIKLKKDLFDFTGLSEVQVAEKIRKEKLKPTSVMGALRTKMTPVIAAAILEQATGDQAVILRETFDKQGLLKNKEVMKVFTEKIKTAKTALDRVEKITTEIDEDVEKALKSAKAEKRKEQTGDIGRIFLHLDISSSMHEAIDLAKEYGSIIAECVNNPEDNFHWGAFNTNGYLIKKPETFEKDAFHAALYGLHPSGMTDCFACYKKARELSCDVDIYITDQGHNAGPGIKNLVEKYGKPSAAVIVDTQRSCNTVENLLQSCDIPVTVIKPSALKESALVAQAIKTAVKGASAVLDEIMAEPLLKLPKWWFSVK